MAVLTETADDTEVALDLDELLEHSSIWGRSAGERGLSPGFVCADDRQPQTTRNTIQRSQTMVGCRRLASLRAFARRDDAALGRVAAGLPTSLRQGYDSPPEL